MQVGCNCADLNSATRGSDDRVGLIADAAPDCACEKECVSSHSPGPVQHDETIVRMVCAPIHVQTKKPELKPSFFNHAFTRGMSAQRLEKASDEEIATWVNRFVSADAERAWLGYVVAPTRGIREVRSPDSDEQGFCVYDTALEDNRAHVDVCASRRIIEEADRVEARARLRRAFSAVLPRASLNEGRVLALVHDEVAAREVPTQWKALVG
jgi:hypothetical protein